MLTNRVRATTRFFMRTKARPDPDGGRTYDFPEVLSAAEQRGPANGLLLRRRWTVRVRPDGVREGTLTESFLNGMEFRRPLRRIEEDHLLKFAIRD